MNKRDLRRVASATVHATEYISRWTIAIKYSADETEKRHMANTKVRNMNGYVRDLHNAILSGKFPEAVDQARGILRMDLPPKVEYDPD